MVLSDVIRIGTFANQPAANAVPTGTLYYSTDLGFLQRSNGTTWDFFSPNGSGLQVVPPSFYRRIEEVRETRFVPQPAAASSGGSGGLVTLVPPVNANYSWANQGSASVNVSSNAIQLVIPAASGVNIRMRYLATPATPWQLTTAIIPFNITTSPSITGICYYDSSGGKVVTFGYGFGTTYGFRSSKFNSTTSFSADYTSLNAILTCPYVWLRIADDGTNRTSSFSVDGINFTQFHQVSRTDFMTANAVGFFGDTEQTTFASLNTLVSWTF